VTFVVPSGPGEVQPGLVTTDESGVAATDTWVLGDGTNTVVATPQEPVDGDETVTEIDFDPTSITFTAEGTENPIEYRSPGYSFIPIGATPPSGSTTNYPAGQWFLPGFVPTAAWSVGGAPFGQAGSGCSIFTSGGSPVVTPWAAGAGSQANPATGTGLLVRRVFTTPVGYIGGVVIHVAIDNDIQVYLDGTDITDHEDVSFVGIPNTESGAPNGSWNGYLAPFQAHSGCAQQGDGTFSVPGSLLSEGTTHVIAVYAHDWGAASYLDIEVTLED
jgi:hypothetical protein